MEKRTMAATRRATETMESVRDTEMTTSRNTSGHCENNNRFHRSGGYLWASGRGRRHGAKEHHGGIRSVGNELNEM